MTTSLFLRRLDCWQKCVDRKQHQQLISRNCIAAIASRSSAPLRLTVLIIFAALRYQHNTVRRWSLFRRVEMKADCSCSGAAEKWKKPAMPAAQRATPCSAAAAAAAAAGADNTPGPSVN